MDKKPKIINITYRINTTGVNLTFGVLETTKLGQTTVFSVETDLGYAVIYTDLCVQIEVEVCHCFKY